MPTRPHSLAPLCLLLACSDYDFVSKDKDGGGAEETTFDSASPVVDTGEAEEEICNGEDDDHDGEIDEGFEDLDGDGVADCVDDDCVADGAPAGTVDLDEDCAAYDPGEVADPWDVAVEWNFSPSSNDYSVVSPVVGQLTDDDGNGTIDDADTPDVAITGYYTGKLYLLSGDGSGAHCSISGFRSDGGVALGDINGDGRNEVVGPLTNGRLMAVDGTCAPIWTSANTYSLLYPVCSLADLDGDGDVEVICDAAVVDGATGAHVAQLSPSNGSLWRTPAIGDLDQDGQQEIVLADSVFSSNGTRLWSISAPGATSCFASIQDVDGDLEGEVAFSCGNKLTVIEADGTPIWTAGLSVANPGPPCAGDIDGDGEVEIIAPHGGTITAFNHDGSTLWSATMQDNSGAAGCAVFDMNGDSVYEVLFADETALRVYDGATGAVLYDNKKHGSVTYFETPTIADVDNDGSAEMLVVNSSGSYGMLTVFGHNGSGWPTAGPTWGIHDYAATNQNSDGSIPTLPTASWQAYNIFRGRPSSDIPGAQDLELLLLDVCVSSCDPTIGTVAISWQVSNPGGADSTDATTLSLYMLDEAGAETLYATESIGVIPTGESLASGEFVVPAADFGAGGFTLRVDDDGTGAGVLEECHEDNNEVVYAESFCDW